MLAGEDSCIKCTSQQGCCGWHGTLTLRLSGLQGRQSQVQMAKLEALHGKQQAVLRRKTQEADAARKRLQVPFEFLKSFCMQFANIFVVHSSLMEGCRAPSFLFSFPDGPPNRCFIGSYCAS